MKTHIIERWSLYFAVQNMVQTCEGKYLKVFHNIESEFYVTVSQNSISSKVAVLQAIYMASLY